MICVQPVIIKDNVLKESNSFVSTIRKTLRQQRGVENWQPGDKGIAFFMLHAYVAGVRAASSLSHHEKPVVIGLEAFTESLCPTMETSDPSLTNSALVYSYQHIELPVPREKESFTDELPEVSINDLDILGSSEKEKEEEGDSGAAG